MSDGRPRYYVASVNGHTIMDDGLRGPWGVSYMVLDRAYSCREVFRSYTGDTWLHRGRVRFGRLSATKRRRKS